jgi:hypothetical protein
MYFEINEREVPETYKNCLTLKGRTPFFKATRVVRFKCQRYRQLTNDVFYFGRLLKPNITTL